MIVECSYCKARVDAKVVAQHVDPPEEESGLRYTISLLSCPTCHNSLVVCQAENQYKEHDGSEWDDPTRVWPSPDKYFSWHIPTIVRSSLEEANKCFKAGAYSACAVMCGRALEGICKHYKTKSAYLADGLKELHQQGVIDGRLIIWSDALRLSRNIGAHATASSASHDEARDVLLFANAICEYVFVLSAQFEEFMKRGEKPAKKP